MLIFCSHPTYAAYWEWYLDKPDYGAHAILAQRCQPFQCGGERPFRKRLFEDLDEARRPGLGRQTCRTECGHQDSRLRAPVGAEAFEYGDPVGLSQAEIEKETGCTSAGFILEQLPRIREGFHLEAASLQ